MVFTVQVQHLQFALYMYAKEQGEFGVAFAIVSNLNGINRVYQFNCNFV